MTEPEPTYITFSSPSSFTLAVSTKKWGGTLYYSTDSKNWTLWDGSQLSGGGATEIYVRGTGNTVISSNSAWTLTGTNVSCTGNIENLLDWQTVAAGEHPTMAASCYRRMFYGCTSLRAAPALPATTLTASCYASMFSGCTSLRAAPALPATTLTASCYQQMFQTCTSLTAAPSLPATTLANGCYQDMFYTCSSLTQIPALPATVLKQKCYCEMFQYCSEIKLSTTQDSTYKYAYRIPMSGTGTSSNYALDYMFSDTGGSFTSTPSINTTYYTANEIVYP